MALECMFKLACAARFGLWEQRGRPDEARIGPRLGGLETPSAGHWAELYRALGKVLGKGHPLLDAPRGERRGMDAWAEVCRRWGFGPEAQAQIACRGRPEDVFDFLVPYRNDVRGHGGQAPEAFLEEASDAMLVLVAELTEDLFGGLALWVAKDGQWRRLAGQGGIPIDDPPPEDAQPGRLYFVDGAELIGLHPIVQYMDWGELEQEAVAFLNRTRRRAGGIVTEFLDYRTARPVPELAGDPGVQAFLARWGGGGWRARVEVVETSREELPAETTPCIGREQEVRAVLDGFDAGRRLVTLTGPAGIGKSRVALAAVREASATRRWRVELAQVTERAGIVSAVAQAIGVTLDPSLPLAESEVRLGRALGEGLLLLDNADEAVEALAGLVDDWLRAAPGLRVVVSSRTRLGTASESCVVVGPLSVEHGRALFLERAHLGSAGGAGEAVERLVEALDGNPLALELAAARVAFLGVSGLTRRLDKQLDVLKRRGAEGRHASVRTALDMSWRQLSAPEQQALAELSVFRGGFELEAVEAVVQVGEDPLDLLESLQAQSLVHRVEGQGLPRFDLYGAIRLYASERLEGSEAETRHRAWFLELGDGLCSRADGPDAAEVLGELRLERGNLERIRTTAPSPDERAKAALALVPLLASEPVDARLAVLEQARSEGLSATVEVQLLLEVGSASILAGQPERAWEVLDKAAELASDDADLQSLARARGGLALRRARRIAEAVEELDRAVELARRPETLGYALSNLGNIARIQGQTETAEAHLGRALRCAWDARSHRLEAMVRHNLGALLMELGRLDEARQHNLAAGRLYQQLGEEVLRGQLELNAGNTLIERGRFEETEASYGIALQIAQAMGDLPGEALVRLNTALLRLEEGDPAEAHHELDQAEALGREHLPTWRRGLLELNRGLAWHLQGRLPAADQHFSASIEHFEAVDSTARAYPLFRRGAVRAELGRLDEAAADFEAAEALLSGDPAVAVRVARGHLDRAHGRPVPSADDPEVARAAERSGDVRLALALLRG